MHEVNGHWMNNIDVFKILQPCDQKHQNTAEPTVTPERLTYDTICVNGVGLEYRRTASLTSLQPLPWRIPRAYMLKLLLLDFSPIMRWGVFGKTNGIMRYYPET